MHNLVFDQLLSEFVKSIPKEMQGKIMKCSGDKILQAFRIIFIRVKMLICTILDSWDSFWGWK